MTRCLTNFSLVSRKFILLFIKTHAFSYQVDMFSCSRIEFLNVYRACLGTDYPVKFPQVSGFFYVVDR